MVRLMFFSRALQIKGSSVVFKLFDVAGHDKVISTIVLSVAQDVCTRPRRSTLKVVRPRQDNLTQIWPLAQASKYLCYA